MKKTFKKIAAFVMAAVTLAVGSVGMSASASTGTRTATGSAAYGSCKYELYSSECNVTGTVYNNSSSKRYIVEYVYTATTGTGTMYNKNSKSSNVSSGSRLSVSKYQKGHSSGQKHYLKGVLYGSTSGANIPVVETKYVCYTD